MLSLACFGFTILPVSASGGDESTLVSTDPQAKPLNRNAVALGLAAHSLDKKEQIFHMCSSCTIFHFHCELCFHFTC